MPAHSRSQNGVALLVYGGHPRLKSADEKTWMAGTSPAMTIVYCGAAPPRYPVIFQAPPCLV